MTREISHKFNHLTHLAYFVSLATATIGIGGGILLSNTGMAIVGVGSAGLTLCALGNSRDRASHIAATLLSNHNDTWEQKYSALKREHQTLSPRLAESQSHLTDRQHQIDRLQSELNQLQTEKRSIEQNLSTQLSQAQSALQQLQESLEEKRHDLSTVIPRGACVC